MKMPFKIVRKIMKYLEINLMKDVKPLYLKQQNILRDKEKELNKWKKAYYGYGLIGSLDSVMM